MTAIQGSFLSNSSHVQSSEASQNIVDRVQLLVSNFQKTHDEAHYLSSIEGEIPSICDQIFQDPESTLQVISLLSNSNVEAKQRLKPYLLSTQLVYIKSQHLRGNISLQEAAQAIVPYLEEVDDFLSLKTGDLVFDKAISSLLVFDDEEVRKLSANIIRRHWICVTTWKNSASSEDLEKEISFEKAVFEAIALHKHDKNLKNIYIEIVEKLLIIPYLFNNPEETLKTYKLKYDLFINGRCIKQDTFEDQDTHFTLSCILNKIKQGYENQTHFFLNSFRKDLDNCLATLNHLMLFYKHIIDDPCRVISIGESFLSLTAAFENSQDESCIHYFHDVKAQVLGNLGNAYDRQNQTERSISCYLEGLDISKQQNIVKAISIYQGVLNNQLNKIIGISFLHLPNHQIENYLSLGLQIAKVLDCPDRRFILYTQLGIFLADSERCHEGLTAITKSLKIAKSLDDPWKQAQSLGNLGIIHRKLGNYVEAEGYFLEQLRLMKEMSDVSGQGRAYAALGSMASGLGQYSRAVEFYTNAISLIEKYEKHTPSSDDKIDLLLFEQKWKCYSLLGDVLMTSGANSQAIEIYSKVLKLSENNLFLKNEMQAAALSGMGYAYRKMAEDEPDLNKQTDYFLKAIDCAEESLIRADSRNDASLLVSSHTCLGNIFLRLKKFENAIEHYLKSLEIDDQGEREESKAKSHLNLAYAYFSCKRFSEAKMHALQALELWNSQNEHLGKQDEWKITYFEQFSSIHRCLELILITENTPDTRNEALLISEWRKASVLNQAIQRKMEASEMGPLSIQEIQGLALRTNSTFLIYSVVPLADNEPELIAWVVPFSGKIQCERLSIQSIESDIKGLKTLFNDFPFERRKNTNLVVKPLEALPSRGEEREEDLARELVLEDYVEKNLARWHQALIAPIEKYLPQDPNQTLTIVPDGFLAQFPFAAFQGEDGKFLIEKHPISIQPSIKTLQLLDKLHNQREPGSLKDSLIVGNPSVPMLRNLSIGQAEAVGVGKLLDVADSDMQLAQKATVSRFLEKAPHAPFIFASCHGEADCKPTLDPHSIFEGQLKLTPDERYPNGNLHSQQISNLDLSAELVFLSACYSGVGKTMQEGTIGNVWSFLAAGALSTVATYWPLPETNTTRRMVDCFFKHILGIGGAPKLNKAQALQQAMLLGMRLDPSGFNQWGAFYLSGLQ